MTRLPVRRSAGQQNNGRAKPPELHLINFDASSTIGQEQAERRLQIPGQAVITM